MDKDNNTRFDQFSRFEQKPEWEIPRTTSDFDQVESMVFSQQKIQSIYMNKM